MENLNRTGEQTVVINGTSYALKPTFQAIASIEIATGMELLPILGKVARGSVSTGASVLFQAIKTCCPDESKTLSVNDVGEAYLNDMRGDKVLFEALLLFIRAYLPTVMGSAKEGDGKKDE